MTLSRFRPLLLLPGLALQGLALAWLLRDGGAASTLSAHVLGSLVCGFGGAGFLPQAQRRSWWLVAAWSLAFPVAGPLAALACAAILRNEPVDRSGRHYVVWKDEAHDATDGPPLGAAGQSIIEILQSPRTQLRRNAVLALRDLDPQMAIPLLRKGLQDSDEQVRIYAQNILSSMLERFEASVKQLEERLASDPNEYVTAKRLAEQYFELVYLDVAGDDETSAHYLGKALALLERIAASPDADHSIAFLGFRYALRARDVAAAHRWLQRLEGPSAEAQHVLPWRMELAFLEGDWDRLRALFSAFEKARYINPRIEELGRFWLGPASSPPAP
jgi:tetratricopeptide (TPR) repeat protein